jgi:DNA end-binding protein Ku
METRIKSILAGSITFGLINIAVKVFSAVQESNLEMNMLHKNDYSNIKFKRVNENTGKEVTYAPSKFF